MNIIGDTIHVLHVDDEPDLADLVARFLEEEDERITVDTAANADDGLDILAGGEIDCIVSDYDMPGRNGIEFLETVREDHPDLPFILYTGKGSEEVASDAISAGVTDYLQKGGGTDQYTVLANRIRNAVDRRNAELERKRQLEAIETAREGISILDEDGHYIYVNRAFADLHGYDPGEMVGEHWELAYRDEDVPAVREEILPEVERAGNWRGETTSLRADGSTVTVDHTLATTDRGELICTVRDISDRKRREQELRQTTARLEALFENSPDLINVHDTDGNLIDPNPRLCEETGYDASELTGMKVWDLDGSIDPETAYELWEEMTVGDRRRFEGTYRRRDGSTFPVEVHIRRLRLEGEDRFIAIARDVTERKDRERELERYEQIVEELDDIATIIDPDGTITYVSPSVRRVLGYEPDELVGENGFDYQPAETGEAVGDAVDRVLDEPDEPQTVQTRFRRADGSLCWIESTLRNRLEDELIDGILVSSREISERVRRRQELKRQNERLDEFASVVSHDLRNPLHMAAAHLELAGEECESEHLDAIAQAHDRMYALIDDVLTLAREESPVADTELVDLAAIADGCWTTVETANGSLVIECDRSVRSDERHLKQLLENLIRNAVEHGGDGVTVTVGELADGFYVEDDGSGIPEDERDDVFEAGYSTSEAGKGFGLSIVERACDAHDWDVRVTDGSAGGARFEVTGVEFDER